MNLGTYSNDLKINQSTSRLLKNERAQPKHCKNIYFTFHIVDKTYQLPII